MKSEDEPITDDEWLIRLVWGMRVRPDRTPIIGISSFEPRKTEEAGISLFRRACLSDPLEALGVVQEANRDSNAIVCIRVVSLRELGCTLCPDRIPQVMGHVLVPEINYSAYRGDKKEMEKWFLRLALEASANIVRYPLN